MKWLERLFATLRPNKLDRDLDDELHFHLEQRTDEFMAQGMSPRDAHREAARRFGNSTLEKERARDRDILIWLETALQDLRYALRTLRRNPGFALTAILSLALGIGANTALFSVTDALLLKRLPVSDPASLARVRSKYPQFENYSTLSYTLFDLIRHNARTVTGATAAALGGPSIQIHGAPVPAHVEIVSGEYFDVLGVSASRGRVFHDASAPIAVISDSFWRGHFASAEVLGTTFTIGKTSYTIGGVASAPFRGESVDWPADVWIPLEQAVPGGARRGPNWVWLEVIARLAPGVTMAQANAELESIQQQHLQQLAGSRQFDHPQQRSEFFDKHLVLQPAATGTSGLREHYIKPLLIVVGIAAIVLLIACTNLANLLLARATAREREIATRKAIGAGRGRLIRQLLTESAVITTLGAIAAVFLARWLNAALLAFFPDASHALANLSFRIDARLLAFMIGICAITALLAGLAPAIRASGPPRAHLSSGGRALIAVEVALCTILLIGSGWFVRTLRNLRTLDAGFVRDQILFAMVTAPTKGDAPARFEELRAQLSALPGVRSVGYSNYSLMIGDDEVSDNIAAQGHQPTASQSLTAAELRISPGFFETMGTPLLAGRDFADRDQVAAPKVAIVNEAFAKHFFHGLNVIGQRFGDDGPKSAGDFEIVGLVKDAKYASLREEPRPIYYRPFAQLAKDQGMSLVIRSAGDLATLAPVAREVINRTDPKVSKIGRFSTLIDASLASERMVAQLSAAFGGLALLVACIGIYGILAYRVARRTREIGVRIALGASRGGVQWMIVRESLILLIIGIVIGTPIALGLARYIKSLLYGLTPADPWTLAVALVVLALVSSAAALLPARRASKIDPMSALRCD